jgi:peptide/nickel transport system ATP-binding protein
LAEEGTRDDIFDRPQHIYAKRLIAAIPNPDPRQREAQREQRIRVEREFTQLREQSFDREGKPHPLKRLTESHSAAVL